MSVFKVKGPPVLFLDLSAALRTRPGTQWVSRKDLLEEGKEEGEKKEGNNSTEGREKGKIQEGSMRKNSPTPSLNKVMTMMMMMVISSIAQALYGLETFLSTLQFVIQLMTITLGDSPIMPPLYR